MGIGNVQSALIEYPNISDFAMRALVQMAAMALDRDTPPKYYGGWEATARALGRRIPDLRDDLPPDQYNEVLRLRSNAQRAVGRAVKELVACGAVIRTNRAKVGQRSVYDLNL